MTTTTRLKKIEDRIKNKAGREEAKIRIVTKTAEDYFEEDGTPLSKEENQQLKDGVEKGNYIILTDFKEEGLNVSQ